MAANKRLGLIMPELSDPLDYELLSGIYDTAKALGYDVFLYTGIYNSHIDLQQDSYIRGLENIYTLPAMQQLDGILFAAERFHNRPVLDAIRRQLTATQVPCIVLGEAMLPFENMQIPAPIGYEGFLEEIYGRGYMTKHKFTATHDYPFYKKQEAWRA